MRSSHVAGAAASALLGLALLSQTAQATPGYLNQGMNLRAGPGVDYPWIASLPEGTQTEIYGCLPGWSWCDVAVEGLRGWIAGAGLQVLYEDQPEPLTGYGTEMGLPFIGFNFGNYWGQNYRDRPWFSEHDRWHGPGGSYGDRGRGPGQPDDHERWRGAGGPYGDRGHGPGQPDGGEHHGWGGEARGGFGGRGPETGRPGEVEGPPGAMGRGPGFQGPRPGGFGQAQPGQQPGFNRGFEARGLQPGIQNGGGSPGGAHAAFGPGRGQPGPQPGAAGHPDGPQAQAPGRGGPGQQAPH